MVTGKTDPSQTDLEVPRPMSSTSFRFSKAAPKCCCQHAASTNCTSTRLTQEVVSRVRGAGSLRVRGGPPSTGPSRLSAHPLRVRTPGNIAMSGFELAV